MNSILKRNFSIDIYRLKNKNKSCQLSLYNLIKTSTDNRWLIVVKVLNNLNRYYYNAYELIYNIINSWEQHRKCIRSFYEIDFENLNVIFDISIWTNQNIIIYSTTSSWRFKIDINKFELFESKEFIKKLKL